MGERTLDARGTRRDVLRLAGAAALGAAGAAALTARTAHASGSGATIAWVPNPQHLTSGHLNPGQEVVIGPFFFPGTSFDSTNYYGIVGNLTASHWKHNGWMSVRPNGAPFVAGSQAINLHFGGHGIDAWSNFFVCQFGFPGGATSDGKFIIRNGPAAADYLVDLHGFMNIDQ